MTSRILCQLDRNALGDGLTIDDGGLIVTTNRNALDAQRVVLGNLAVSSGVHTFEIYVYSTSRGDLSGLVSIGVAEVGAPLDEMVGDNAESFGIRPADGEIWTNGGSVNTFDPLPERTCIGVTVDLDSPTPQVRWSFNGSSLYFRTLTADKAWVPAISIGAAEAGDVSVVANFGQWRFDAAEQSDGWYTETQGRATLYLAHATQGFLSATADTPSNQPFDPVILNPASIVIRRSPEPWVMSGGGGTPAAAAFTAITLDNSDGSFNWLRKYDARGSTVVVQTIPANSETLDDATTQFTARVDSVRSPTASTIEIRLRDILADLDVPLPCRIVPPFADESSRGRIWPIGLGAQRNIRPMLLDAPSLIYILGDAPMTNVPLVADGGAALDPSGAPPQYMPAMNGTCVQLDTDPVIRLSVDCSSTGEDTVVPGTNEDVFGGIGDFETWASGEPAGWDVPASPPLVVANGSILQTTSYGPTNACAISSNVPLSLPSSPTYFGYYIKTTANYLEPGRTYRISIDVRRIIGTPDQYGDPNFGLIILTKLSNDQRYWVSGYRQPISQWQANRYTFVYTVPASESSALPLYLSVMSRLQIGNPPTTFSAIAVVDNVTAVLLGQYEQAPLEGITLTQADRELLVLRKGLPDAVYSTDDTEYLDEQTGIKLGARWETAPNTAAALQELADTYCAVVFTDAAGVIRCKRYEDPEIGTSVATIDWSNVDLDSISIAPIEARGLTTEFGYRRNCTPLAPGDFVTDTATVPPTQREAWSGVSQGRFTSSKRPSNDYAFAIGAPRFHMLCAEAGPAKREADRVLSMFETVIPARNGINDTAPRDPVGKRQGIRLRAYAPGGLLGSSDTIATKDVMFGTVLTVNLPELGLVNKKVGVIEWAFAPFGDWIEILGDFR